MPTANKSAKVRKGKERLCTPVKLPEHLVVPAAAYAVDINPANAPALERFATVIATALMSLPSEWAKDAARAFEREPDAVADVMPPERFALLVQKYWGSGGVDLSVSFMENTTPTLQNKILEFMNLWGAKGANVRFRATGGDGDVRISRGPGGFYSYLGTDCRSIPRGRQTMNLEGFTLKTPESEYLRVVCHESGHAIGAPHEHMRRDIVGLLDPEKTIAYFRRTQGWSAQETRQQVLTPLEEGSLMIPGVQTPPADQDSIMAYQLPASITRNGQPIRGGNRINAADYAYVGKVYPGAAPPPPASSGLVAVDVVNKVVTMPSGWTAKTA